MNRQINRRSVVTTIVVFVVCLIIVTGSTFSLFTSESNVNIAVTSGKVEMNATLGDLIVCSKDVEQNRTDGDKKLFENGGYAELIEKNSKLEITNMTPGDSVQVTITMNNTSNVDIAYRVVWTYNGELGNYLTATVDDKNITGGISEWMPWNEAGTKTHSVAIELPLDIGNKAQEKAASITFKVEAVQANATAEYDPTAYVNTGAGLLAAANAGATKIILNESVELTETLVIPAAPATYSLGSTPATVIDLNGKTITAAASIADSENCALIMNRGNLVITNGTINVENATAIRNHGATANLVLENMTVTQTGSDVPSEWLASAVFTSGGATTVIENGTYTGVSSAVIVATSGGNLTINGGTFTAEKAAARVDSWSYNSVLTINDGTFNSANKALYADGYKYVTVNGGTFNATIDSTYTNIDIKGGTFNVSIKQPGGHQNYYNISGGTFIENVSNFVANGYSAVDNLDGTFVIVPFEGATTITSGFYFVEAENTYYINSAAGLKAFATAVNAPDKAEYYGNTFSGMTVVLMNDIDLGGEEWDPIGNFGNSSKQFAGIFDGQGYTVSNFKITQKTADRAGKNRSPHGFFGNVSGTIKNLTISGENLTVVDDGRYAGLLVGRLNSGIVENCHVAKSNLEIDYWQAGGLVGIVNGNCTIKGCSVVDTTVTGPSAIGALVGPATLSENGQALLIENCLVKNCQVVMKDGFGGKYDNYFGTLFGYLDSADCLVNINNCVVENTTVKGVLGGVGTNDFDGTNIHIDGNKMINSGLTKAEGNTYNVYSAAGLAAMHAKLADKTAGQNVVINIMSDIDFAGNIWTTVDSHVDFGCSVSAINGNGHTISNLTVNGQAMFRLFAGFGDVTISDLTFDGATVNGEGGINAALIVGQTYQNLLLDNVDVKNSTVKGQYKVAILIGSVYNENTTSITATVKNCDVDNCVSNTTYLDFMTCGLVAFVYADDNDNVVFENTTISNTTLLTTGYAGYDAHGFVYSTGSESCYDEAEGVTVTNCGFERR